MLPDNAPSRAACPVQQYATVRDIWTQWLAALESGRYRKGIRRMCTLKPTGGKSYCCLGVLVEVIGMPYADEPGYRAYHSGLDPLNNPCVTTPPHEWWSNLVGEGALPFSKVFMVNDCDTKDDVDFTRVVEFLRDHMGKLAPLWLDRLIPLPMGCHGLSGGVENAPIRGDEPPPPAA